MNKPRLKFEIYKYPLPLMKKDFDTEYDREKTYFKIFGKEGRIHVATYSKSALKGMQEAIILKELKYESQEYKEYYQLNNSFMEIFLKETSVDWDGDLNNNID